MRLALGTMFFTTAAIAAAVVLYVGFTVPPASRHTGATPPATFVTGAYHVHSIRSDGTGTVEAIAADAAAAGLSFVVFTDHGDATRTPDPPAYRSGVLTIDAVEVNTSSGHVVALGLYAPAPYPLAGTAADVIDDIHRLGGVAAIAHPDSPNPGLRWRATGLAYDGIEWLNADSEWRDERPAHLIATAARALFRQPEAMASLFALPSRTLERWDRASRRAPVFGVAALDAHASIPWRETEEPRRRSAIAAPTYRAMFRTLAQTVVLDAPLSGDAAADARRVLAALTAGRSFSIVRAFAEPASLEFSAEQGSLHVAMGGRIGATGDTVFHAAVSPTPGLVVSLLRDGRPVATSSGPRLDYTSRGALGVYRVQATLAGRTMPWLVSNPIVVGADLLGVAAPVAPVPDVRAWYSLDGSLHPWKIEKDRTSSGPMDLDHGDMRVAYRLGAGMPAGQYVALAGAAETAEGIDRVRFTGRADRPTRISVQIRLPRGGEANRWRRSIYLDATPRTVTVNLREFEPADTATTLAPNVTPIDSVLFVVDTVNTRPGTSGTIWIGGVELGLQNP